MRGAVALALAGLLAAGCAASTRYRPEAVAPAELIVQYDSGLQIWSGHGPVAGAPTYDGLAEFVYCDAVALKHAQAAESAGSAGLGLSVASIGLAVVGLGGLAGLAYQGEDEGAMIGLLVGGLVVESVAIVLGGLSLDRRAQANGNALDAVNFYNDSVGSLGRECIPR